MMVYAGSLRQTHRRYLVDGNLGNIPERFITAGRFMLLVGFLAMACAIILWATPCDRDGNLDCHSTWVSWVSFFIGLGWMTNGARMVKRGRYLRMTRSTGLLYSQPVVTTTAYAPLGPNTAPVIAQPVTAPVIAQPVMTAPPVASVVISAPNQKPGPLDP